MYWEFRELFVVYVSFSSLMFSVFCIFFYLQISQYNNGELRTHEPWAVSPALKINIFRVLGDFGKTSHGPKLCITKGKGVNIPVEGQLFISVTIDYSISYLSVVIFYLLIIDLFILMLMIIRELCWIFWKGMNLVQSFNTKLLL